MTAFADELEIFRTEEQLAQQLFLTWVSMRQLAGTDPAVLKMMNETPLYWTNVEHALLLGAFVVLGRVFDQKSKHNVDSLIRAAGADLDVFSLESLRSRKEALRITPEQAANYVAGRHALSTSDVRTLRKQVAHYRRIYVDRYRDVRDQFAHKNTAVRSEIDALFAKTNTEEMKEIFGFLHGLHDAMWELLFNGRRPDVQVRKFTLPSDSPVPGRQLAPGEMIAREAQAVMRKMLSAAAARPSRS
jgi:hypothetical protein